MPKKTYTLEEWMQKENLKPEGIAKLFRFSLFPTSINRYLKGRIPISKIMKELFRISKGEVTPNDFYKVKDWKKEFNIE